MAKRQVTSLDRKCRTKENTNLVHAIDHHDAVEWDETNKWVIQYREPPSWHCLGMVIYGEILEEYSTQLLSAGMV
jgi:hypothetical protein